MSKRELLINGIIKENPTFVLMLGMCPTLAVTTSAFNGLGMGLSATAVLVCSNIVISILKKAVPDMVRVPCYIVVIAGFVTVVQMLLQAFLPSLNEALGLFIPLIVVNCIILGRAEMFASKNTVSDSAVDGLGMGLGFTLALTAIGIIREVLGAGAIFGFEIPGDVITPTGIFMLAPGGFFVLAILIALKNQLQKNSSNRRDEFGCEGCLLAGNCSGSECEEKGGRD